MLNIFHNAATTLRMEREMAVRQQRRRNRAAVWIVLVLLVAVTAIAIVNGAVQQARHPVTGVTDRVVENVAAAGAAAVMSKTTTSSISLSSLTELDDLPRPRRRRRLLLNQCLTSHCGSFEVLERVPKDAKAFTQGLVYVQKTDGSLVLYEGTGLYGKSELRKVDLPTGQVLQRASLSGLYFGEGIAYYTTTAGAGRIVQLTWKNRIAFIYDSETFQVLGNITFTTTNNEGWGITLRSSDNTLSSSSSFIVSDGSAYLHFWDPNTWTQTKRIRITKRWLNVFWNPIKRLNELEYDPYTDTVLANVWYTNLIHRINLETGRVIMTYDMSSLYPVLKRPKLTESVLNGIAMVPGEPNQVWVTGKLWDYMFRIRLTDA